MILIKLNKFEQIVKLPYFFLASVPIFVHTMEISNIAFMHFFVTEIITFLDEDLLAVLNFKPF